MIERRHGLGRRAADQPWGPRAIAECIGMSEEFVRDEIKAGELKGSQFGRLWRVAPADLVRYLTAKGWPLPASLGPRT